MESSFNKRNLHTPFKSWEQPVENVRRKRYLRRKNPEFASYSLSPDELDYVNQHRIVDETKPMKEVAKDELMLLKDEKIKGTRLNYLLARQTHSPRDKYYYPEATSWRYGWFHESSQERHH